jgi:hypothetical protein
VCSPDMIINAHDYLAEVWKLMIQKRKTIISRSSDSACNARPVNSGNARYELAVRKTKIMTARCGRVALSRVGTNLGRAGPRSSRAGMSLLHFYATRYRLARF